MRELAPRPAQGLEAGPDQPLIGLVVQQDGQEVVRYFADEAAAEAAAPESAIERALAAIGSWSDLDFEETLAALDRIRHESTPAPPVVLDL